MSVAVLASPPSKRSGRDAICPPATTDELPGTRRRPLAHRLGRMWMRFGSGSNISSSATDTHTHTHRARSMHSPLRIYPHDLGPRDASRAPTPERLPLDQIQARSEWSGNYSRLRNILPLKFKRTLPKHTGALRPGGWRRETAGISMVTRRRKRRRRRARTRRKRVPQKREALDNAERKAAGRTHRTAVNSAGRPAAILCRGRGGNAPEVKLRNPRHFGGTGWQEIESSPTSIGEAGPSESRRHHDNVQANTNCNKLSLSEPRAERSPYQSD